MLQQLKRGAAKGLIMHKIDRSARNLKEAFLTRADHMGAGAFTESPLSLRLLRKVVADGNWPATRFELFDNAVTRVKPHHLDPDEFHQLLTRALRST